MCYSDTEFSEHNLTKAVSYPIYRTFCQSLCRIFSEGFFYAIIITFLLASVRPLIAQENTPTPLAIGVINLENVQLESLAFQSLREQIDKLRNNIQERIKTEQESIKAEQEKLEEQRLLLSSDALTEKQEAIQQKVATLREFADGANKSLEEVYNRSLLLIRSKLQESLTEVAGERSLTLILNENNLPPTVIFSANSLRIDEIVLKKLNDRINAIQITENTVEENLELPATENDTSPN